MFVQYKLKGSIWSGFNFVLSFLLLYLCANFHLLTLYMAADIFCAYRDLPLKPRV